LNRPILFSTPMVQAILEGRKTQTRRVIKDKVFQSFVDAGFTDGFILHPENNIIDRCPYGKPGDTLWVRETWQLLPSGFDEIPPEMNYIYKATDKLSDECTRWRPSIFMPREAARLFLTVKNIRVERLQDITEEDATKEGIRGWTKDTKLYKYCVGEVGENGNVWRDMPRTAREAFESLWDGINKGRGYGWDTNPWVWVVEFEKQ
jgi:hypothetical protein